MNTNLYFKNIGRLFLTALDNLCFYKLGIPPSRAPLFINWDINSNCNTDCIYCKRKHAFHGNLSFEEKISLIRQLGRKKAWMLSLAGGEPLMEDGLDKLIYEIKENGLLLNISTNGLLLKEKAKILINSGVDFLTISADTHIKELQDRIRRKSGVTDAILEGIEAINALKKNKRSAPHINIRIIVHNQNYKTLDESISFWKKIADDVILQPIHESDTQNFVIPAEYSLSKTAQPAFKTDFKALLKKHGMDNEYNCQFNDFLFNKPAIKKKYKCFASFFFMNIDQSGNIYSCGEHFLKLGSLKTGDVTKILNSQERKAAGKAIIEGHCSRDCWYNCWIMNVILNKFL
jgi:MoaA/NifB/PqqE/SkfB family radical SAM enzyme